MGRLKQFASNAARQKAYRTRKLSLCSQPTSRGGTNPLPRESTEAALRNSGMDEPVLRNNEPCVTKKPGPTPGTLEWVEQELAKIKAGR